ncbi:hypothetical protein AN7862.2 [Aspergillus nidulans FGSC A4]|uniref:Uncharacterized protein n=1 Tax=Emericella nidulans (strain FGSC A4 / ATCC 38163 / CBS 112.46 / NRRL 194 / M139) TaxID=227321 RepID=Q5AV18_EMENI|nr:hypothetical protein [Aspergillus nidulans FGSC A4]EAA58907.1 hypothetical protein AN7862.2 [Aspergillus nidulans FGSC A4]CBF73405.1 TPA: conserved hypothetical protein [Aspergillus nidulans FGSC A4]|eukprot:XP_681131.1 hypothetical protein AN7862.2 [Aspergillus nidulans FGSC A4]
MCGFVEAIRPLANAPVNLARHAQPRSDLEGQSLHCQPLLAQSIIYMDIAIDQPTNCQLESARVLITLDDPAETRTRREGGKPLQMTDYYGPKQLSREVTKVTVARSVHLVPQVNVMGSGGGGIGVEKERSASYLTRWSFTSGLLTREHLSQCYRTLKWE